MKTVPTQQNCYDKSILLSQLHALLVGVGLLCKIVCIYICFILLYKCTPRNQEHIEPRSGEGTCNSAF